MEKYGRQAKDIYIIRRMRFMCSITKATDEHTEYVTRTAVPQQKLLHESALNITFVRKLSVLLSNRNEPR